MVNLFPIEKQQEHPIFGRFNALFGEKLVDYCSLLGKFQINVYSTEEYKRLPGDIPRIEDIDKQVFASFIVKYGVTADTTEAGIVYSELLLSTLRLNEAELFAAIAHEVGHILYFFLENKANYPGPQGEEVYSDGLACRLGLASPMLSTLKKIENSGICPYSESLFFTRKSIIQLCI